MTQNTSVRCRSCRFWTPHRSSYDPTETVPQEKYGACELTLSHDGQATQPESLAYAADRESYQAILQTSPDFGCVQGQPKAEPPAGAAPADQNQQAKD